MPKNSRHDPEKVVEDKLDRIIRLLEDLFILEATKSQVGRDAVRSILRVHNRRISKISKGLRDAK